ncbi:hypothetical protein FKM82_020315 [Ascaphus truei]
MEELDVLRIEQMKRRRNLATFVSKVEQLYIQQDILQKKRQPKDWHKDPLLEELYNVLQTAKRQIKILRSDFANASHKQRQLSAIANILGASPEEINEKLSAEETSNKQEKAAYPPKPDMHPKVGQESSSVNDSDGESKTSSNSKTSSDLKPQSYPNSIFETKSKDIPRSGSDSRLGSSSNSSSSKEKSAGDSKPRSAPKSSTDLKYVPESKVSRSRDDSRLRGDKSRSKSPRPSDPSSKLDDNFPDMSRLLEYFDAENYWCEDCNTVCKTVSDFFSHLHNRKHTQTLNVWKRPWATPTEREARFDMRRKKVVVPLKGPEFLIPIAGFYCQLCQELIGDKICAEEHVKTFAHNQQYKDHIDANSFYEEKRSQNMKSGLAIISEMERKQQTEQKRKLEERTKEANEESAAKKSKKEEEESPKEKLKSPVVVSAKPDPRHSPKPEKEDPMKTPIFGRFTWKARDSKTQAAAASDNSNKEKEEENNGQVVKQKGIEIKLSGKTTIPHGSPWIASPSSSSTSPSSSSNASTSPSSLSQTKVRPNLPIPVTVLRKSSAAPVNKPAPLNTFLSIKSSGTSPKPLPVMKSIPEVALPQVVVSKAFGGQEVVVKETKEAVMQPDKIKPRLGAEAASSAQVTVCKSDERAPSMSECESNISGLPKPPPPRSGVDKLKAKTPDTYDMFSINDGKDSTVERKYGSVSLSQKVFRESSKKSEQKMENEKAATKLKESFSTPLPQVQKTDSPVSKDVGVALFSSSASQSNNDPSIKKPSVCENYGKLPSANKSSDQEARSVPAVGTIESKGNTASISDKGVLVEVSVSSSREAGKWEFLHPQYQKDKDSGAQKLIETKQSGFAYNRKDAVASSNQQTKPIHLPTSSTTACRSEPLFTAKPESNYSNTAKLNQKFKREPLPLPTSVFGRGPEMGRKDIKISSTGIQNSSTNKGKAVIKKQTPTSQEQPKVYTKTNKTVLQEELESYYKLIASEDDAEDVTTSEDQDAAMEAPVGIPCAPVPIKVKSLEKFVSVYPQPSIQLQTQSVLPDSSTEEPDDSDMACEEAPEVPGCASSFVPSRFSTTQLGHFGRRSYRSTRAIQKVPEATTIYTPKSPVKAVDRVPAKNYQGPVDSPAADYTMEDLSVLTTCDDLSD